VPGAARRNSLQGKDLQLLSFFSRKPNFRLDLDRPTRYVLAYPPGFRWIFVSQRVLILSRKEWRTDLDDADIYYIMVVDS